jgi:hypothetical protein
MGGILRLILIIGIIVVALVVLAVTGLLDAIF